jgi:DNA repair protein RadD
MMTATITIDLRDYQDDKVEEIFRLIDAGERRILLVSPTGSGKTVIASEIIRRFNLQRWEILFIDHLREITNQTSRKLNQFGVFNGIIQAKVRATPLAGVQVASIQTLFARAIAGKRMELPPAKVIFVDEAHHAVARTYRRILEAYPDAIVIGLTATPCRGDGRGFGGVFDIMVLCPDVPDLIEDGYLVPSRVYAPAPPDLAGVQVRAGDYVVEQLASRMDKPGLVADIVSTWLKHGEDRQTVVYATNVGHSVHIRDEFISAGIVCEHIDGKTPLEEREEALARFGAKEVRVLTNCAVFTEGWDVPDIGTVTVARPTKSFGLLWQMIGRGRRPAPGKKDLIVLDHGGHFPKMGMPDDRIEWTLDPDMTAARNKEQEKREAIGTKILECSQCGTLSEGGKPCPCCGFLPKPKPTIVIPREGDLVELSRAKPSQPTQQDADKALWHAMLVSIGREKGYAAGWAAHKFKEKFGHWPPRASPQPVVPSPECRAWIRSRNIAWAKAQEKRRGTG